MTYLPKVIEFLEMAELGSKQFSRNRFRELLIGNIKICMSRHQEKPLLPILELPDQPKNKTKGNKNKVYSLSEKHSKRR